VTTIVAHRLLRVEEPVAATGAGDAGWTLVYGKRRSNTVIDRTIIIWGVQSSFSVFTIMSSICKDEAVAAAEPYLRWQGKEKHENVRAFFPSKRVRDQVFHPLKAVCKGYGWNCVPARRHSKRQRDRRGKMDLETDIPLSNRFQTLRLRNELEAIRESVVDAQVTKSISVVDKSGNVQCVTVRGRKKKKRKKASRAKRKARAKAAELALKVGTLNVQGGLRDSIHEIDERLAMKKYDIVALCETRLKATDSVTAKGYTMHRKDNRDGWGGVALLVNSRFAPLLCALKPTFRDQLWAKIPGTRGERDLYVCAAYMPQESKSRSVREAAWAALTKSVLQYQRKGRVVLLGDLNARLGQAKSTEEEKLIGTHCGSKRTSNGKLLLKLLSEANLISLNGQGSPPKSRGDYWYTRQDKAKPELKTVLDYVIVDNHSSQSRSIFGVDYTDLNSDHFLVWARIPAPGKVVAANKRRKRKRYLTEKFAPKTNSAGDKAEAFAARLRFQSSLIEVFGAYKPEDVAKATPGACAVTADFVDKLKSATEKAVGSKWCFKQFRRSWFDQELRDAIGARRKLYASYAKSKNEKTWNLYAQARSDTRKLTQRKKREQYEKLVKRLNLSHDEARLKQCWSILSRMNPNRTARSTNPIRKTDGKLATTASERKEAWAAYREKLGARLQDPSFDKEFYSKVKKKVARLVRKSKRQPKTLLDEPFMVSEIEAALGKLRNGKASGGDEITNEMLKNGEGVLTSLLLQFFNWVNEVETIPLDWCKALLVNLHKKGDKADPDNYRGISLISCLGKLYLSVWATRLTTHFEGILGDEQGGFRPGRSCADQIFTLYETLSMRRREGKETFLLFVDFRKAFDTVWHKGLWQQLWKNGVKGKAWRIIRSLYREIQTSVLVDGECSRYVPSLQGVRQGCPLSPTLFGIFIEELAVRLSKVSGGVCVGAQLLRTLLYADDIVLIADSVEQLQEMIDVLATYCSEWRMSVNISKSQVMVVKARNSYAKSKRWSWSLNGSALKIVEEYTYLGVVIDHNLKWHSHFKNVAARGRLALSRYARTLSDKRVSLEVKRTVLRSAISSRLDYAAEICVPSKKAAGMLESIQHSALTSMLRLNSKSSQAAVRRAAGVLSVQGRHFVRRLRYLSRLYGMPSTRWPRRVFDCTLEESASAGSDCQETDSSSESDDGGIVMDVCQEGPFETAAAVEDWRESHHIYVPKKSTRSISWARRMTNVTDADIFLRCEVDGGVTLLQASPEEVAAESITSDVAWERDEVHLISDSNRARSQAAIIGRTAGSCQSPLAPVARPRLFANLIRTKLMCGSAPLNELVAKTSLGQRDKHCPSCPETVEDSNHFLLNCKEGRDARVSLLKDINDACACGIEETGCQAFYLSLDDVGKMAFLLGGPVDGRQIEREVDDVCRLFVGKIWELRKRSLTENLEGPDQPSTSSDNTCDENSDSDDDESARERGAAWGVGVGMDDDSEEDLRPHGETELSSDDDKDNGDENVHDPEVEPLPRVPEGETNIHGSPVVLNAPFWPIFGSVDTSQPRTCIGRHSPSDLDAHVDFDMQSR
jgi:exonuclease III